jgi:uncharacterized phage protein (TIGR02218 family)
MSKFFTPELLNHYHQPCTTITRCLRIERLDGKIIALTDHDADLIIDNITYQSAAGYTPTAISMQDQGAVNTIDVEGILAVAGVSRDAIAAALFDGAKIFVFEVNYTDLSQGILPLMSGFWGECQLQESRYITEFRSLSQTLQQTIGELYSTTCRAQLGDARCRVNLAELTVEGIVSEIKNNTYFMADGFDQSANTFQYGLLTWKQGKNAGLSMEIKAFLAEAKNDSSENMNGRYFQLVQPMPYAIEVGDIFAVYPGCDKTLTTCKSRFHNVVNFRGEPFIPGLDRMLKMP